MVADLTRFEKSGTQLPGNYLVDIYINGKEVNSRNLQFIDAASRDKVKQPDAEHQDIRDNTGLMACLTKKDLENMGVKTRLFPAIASAQDQACLSPGMYIPDAYTAFNFEKMRLDISLPQAVMQNNAQGYIAPERWDEGINAALLDYSFSGNTNSGRYGDNSSYFLALNSGLNLGAWRLRDHLTWSEYLSKYGHSRQWQHLETYAERTLIPLRSELTIGDSTTNSDVFNSLGFRGVQIVSDDSMSPDSMRGYAPVIRGTANSNAQVTVRQRGYTVYQTFVSPGAFTINDLNPVGSSGDLDVTITEADGSRRQFTVPYSSVPVLQREGNLKYGVTLGRYKASSKSYSQPTFAQGTLIAGLAHGVTLYGGLQLSPDYHAELLGAGVNFGNFGALSTDVTQASSTLADGTRHQGQSLRFLYARSLSTLGTTFQLTGYRYSTQGFHTLDETALKGMQGWLYDAKSVDEEGRPIKRPYTDYYNLYNNKREKIEITLSQSVSHIGSFYLSAIRQNYWNTSDKTNSLQAGFSGSIKKLSYSLSLSHQSGLYGSNRALFLTLSMPLGGSGHPLSASYSLSQNADGEVSHRTGLSGTALEGDRLNWSLSQSYARDTGKSGSLSSSYRGEYGYGNAGYSYSKDYRQFSYGLSGGAILHANGLTLGQPLGETNVLIAVPGVSGVGLENEPGVSTDRHGYAIMPYASIYRENRVALNVNSLDDHTDIDDAVGHVVPTRGAVVRASFNGRSGNRMLLTLKRNGKPLPFGTMIAADNRGGIVGDEGQVYLSGMPDKGKVTATWGEGPDSRCTADYRLSAEQSKQEIVKINAICT